MLQLEPITEEVFEQKKASKFTSEIENNSAKSI